MAKRNFFGDVIHTPDDSPADFAAHAEKRGSGGFYAARISNDGEPLRWCAGVDMNDQPGELDVHGFETEQALRNWLIAAGVPAAEIEREDV